MADPNQMNTDILVKMLKELQKQTNRYQDDDSNNRISRSRGGTAAISNRNIVNDFKRLEREVNYNVEAIRANRKTFGDLKKSIKDTIMPVSRMSKVFDDYRKNFQDYIRSNSDEFKKAANVTINELQRLATSGKSASGMLSSLKTMQDHFGKSLENFGDGLGNMDLQKNLEDKLKKMQEDQVLITDKIAKNKKSKKGTGDLEAEQTNLKNTIRDTSIQLEGIKKANEDYKDDYSKFINEVSNLHSQGIPILEGLNIDSIQYEKFMEAEHKDQEEIVKRLSKNIRGIAAGVVGFEGLLTQYKNVIAKSRQDLVSSAKRLAMTLATVSANQIIKDYNATKKFNVTSVSPFQAGNMGMSQEDLSTLIGQNKTFLRAAGGGDQNKLIDSGQFKELQNTAKMFGLYGKDAAEMAAKFGNFQMQIGGSIDPESIKAVMGDFKKLSDITDMTVDELMDFTQDLNKAGTITLLNAKYADKSEKDRQAAIRNEIDQRLRLNKFMGYSVDYLKQQQQLQTNARYGSVQEMLNKIVGAEIAGADVEKSDFGKSLSKSDLELLKASFNDLSLTGDNKVKGDELQQKYLASLGDETDKIAINAEKILNNGGTAIQAVTGGNAVANRVKLNLLSGLNSEKFGAANIQEQQRARNTRRSINNGQTLDTADIFGKNKGANLAQIKLEDVGAAGDDLTKTFNLLGESATTLKEKFLGLAGNPVGQASAALFDLAKNGLEFAAATRLMQAAGALNGAAGATVGINSTLSAIAATGIGGITSIVVSVLAAAAVGVAVGTLANSIYDSSAKSDFEALNDPSEKGSFSYMMKEIGDRLTFGVYTPNLTDEQRENSKQIWRDKADSRQTIDTLNALTKRGDTPTNNYDMARFLASPQGVKLLSHNSDASTLKDLGANDDVVNKINQQSIVSFMEQALDGRTDDEKTAIFAEMNENMKKLVDTAEKSLTAEEEARQKQEMSMKQKGAIIKAADERVDLVRRGVGF